MVFQVTVVVSVGRKLVDDEPMAIFDFVASARRKLCIHGNIFDEIQSSVLIIARLPLDKVVGVDQVSAIKARLFIHLSNGALDWIFVLVYFSFGERPRILGEE